MKAQVYVVRDSQADATMRPFFFERDAVAIRSFILSVTNANEAMSNTPEDFTLYRVGTYDDESMFLVGEDPVRLINGLEAVQAREGDQRKLQDLHQQIQQIENGEDRHAT